MLYSISNTLYRQTQQILSVSSIAATCFGRVDHNQAFKIHDFKNISKKYMEMFQNLRDLTNYASYLKLCIELLLVDDIPLYLKYINKNDIYTYINIYIYTDAVEHNIVFT